MADGHSPIAVRARAARQLFQRWLLESSDVGILSYGQDGVLLGLKAVTEPQRKLDA
jgi:hypothetical protein